MTGFKKWLFPDGDIAADARIGSFVWLTVAIWNLLNCDGSLPSQGESVNILLNFTQFFETRIEYRFQIFTAHSCDFLLPSYARLA